MVDAMAVQKAVLKESKKVVSKADRSVAYLAARMADPWAAD